MFPHPRVRREGAAESTPRADGEGNGESEAAAEAEAEVQVERASGAGSAVERLSLVEVLLAEVGGWTTAIVCRCHLPLGPFLASDGVVHMDLAIFEHHSHEIEERGEPAATE